MSIPFASAAHRRTYERVLAWMRDLFGADVDPVPGLPAIDVAFNSAIARVGIHDLGGGRTTIVTTATVVAGADLTTELMTFLLHENARLPMGGFGLTAAGEIVLDHAIVGETCDRDELHASVTAVILTADDYDDRITAGWGGECALSRRLGPPPGFSA